ncbi:hypothetical protein BGZ79_008405 [Entomortierella chlamydospora]|nr:hypothetical protein BGZ79_008405 [Entomortierella chlamydospora]
MSIQGPQNSSQGFRPIYNTGTSATPPQSSEPVYIEPHFISQTGEYIVLWDEVLVAFKNASYVRNGNTLVPFLRDENFQILNPLRIRACPGVIFDVFFDSPNDDLNLDSLRISDPPTSPTSTNPFVSPPSYSQVESSSNTTPSYPLPPLSTPLTGDGQIYTNTGSPRYRGDGFSEVITSESATTTSFTNTSGHQPLRTTASAPQYRGNPFTNNSTSFEATPTARAPQLIDANLDFGNSLYNHIQPALPLSPQQSSRIQPQDFYNPPPPPPQQQYFPIPESKTNSDDIAISEYNQGLAYLKGNGVPQDYYKAMDIFHKAAKQGNPKAQCKLALLYYKGDGIPQDFSKAPKWFLRAANQDNGRAQAYLGNMYSMAKVSPRITPCL